MSDILIALVFFSAVFFFIYELYRWMRRGGEPSRGDASQKPPQKKRRRTVYFGGTPYI